MYIGVLSGNLINGKLNMGSVDKSHVERNTTYRKPRQSRISHECGLYLLAAVGSSANLPISLAPANLTRRNNTESAMYRLDMSLLEGTRY